jgi:hypothetical protein
VYYRTGREDLAEDRRDKAERHADAAGDYEKQPRKRGFTNLADKESKRGDN